MERHLVVGFDGGPMSMDAVEWAAGQAASRGASLRILACDGVPADSLVGDAIGAVRDLVEAVEHEGTVALRKAQALHPLLDAALEVYPGPPATVLVRESQRAELLVVGASGRRGAAAFWLGSTARSVARHSTCPVAVVHGLASSAATRRIVVGVDGSVETDAAVRWAADEADRAGATLVIVHCWWYAYLPVNAPSSPARDIEEIEAARLLDRAVEAARERCGGDVVGMLLEGDPTTALLSVAVPGDVIVLGSPSHGAILSRVLGSTVNGVLEGSVVPVIVVPPAADEAARRTDAEL
ncbi:MAG: universal stress protein [Ilumatobacteraceae bacterium]